MKNKWIKDTASTDFIDEGKYSSINICISSEGSK